MQKRFGSVAQALHVERSTGSPGIDARLESFRSGRSAYRPFVLAFGVACSDANEPLDDASQLNLDVATYVTDMTVDDLAMVDMHIEAPRISYGEITGRERLLEYRLQ